MTSRDAKLLMLTGVLLSSWAIGAEAAKPVDMEKRAEELKDLRWGMFICWSFSTFSGKEWTPGVTDAALLHAPPVATPTSGPARPRKPGWATSCS